MAEMTPRERSELVRSQSRAYIASLRQRRLERTGQSAPIPPAATAPGKRPSAFLPSRQATARASGSLDTDVSGSTRAKDKTVTGARPMARHVAPAPARAFRPSGPDKPDASLDLLRQARRPGNATVAKGDAAPPAAKVRSEQKAAAAPPKAKPASQTVAKGIAHDAEPAMPASDEPLAAPLAPRKARHRRPAPPAEPVGAPQDIDVISGLGPALKTKLRRAGIGTADRLASQTPERLREVLGPAGRLVNLEAILRAAASVCTVAAATSGADHGATAPAPSRTRV